MFELGPNVPTTCTADHARTLGEMFFFRRARSASLPALYERPADTWIPITWDDLYLRAARIGKGLLALGLSRGDRVAILGPTQPPWAAQDLGSQLAGLVSFGIYPKQSAEQARYLLAHSEAKVVFVDEPKELETILAAAQGISTLQAIVPWTRALYEQYRGRDPRLVPYERFEQEPLSDDEVRAIQERVDPNETAILIYTSGTTGPPKGAMITHGNILSLLSASSRTTVYLQSDLSLNFLPMAHSAERILGFYGRVANGVPGAYAQSTATVLDDLKTVRPTLFGSVPRIFEKAYTKILGELEKRPPAVQRLFHWALSVGKERIPYLTTGRPVPMAIEARYRVAERLVFARLREVFGGRMRIMVTGAAPTAKAILELFWAAGLPIYEAFGMTEATVITHANRIGAAKLGTVGRVIPPAECKIAEDGEILLRGPWIFPGYFKQKEASEEALGGGWLHTGDIGTIDEEGYLRITDRKKHLIITAGGKNISPANVEKAIKDEESLVSQVHAHGDRRNYLAAILAPSPIETLEWGVPRGLASDADVKRFTKELLDDPFSRSEALNAAMAKVVVHPDFRARLRDAVRRGNGKLAQVEHVRRFVILDRDFSQAAGELTPTMKIRRKEVEAKYAALFDEVYAGGAVGIEV
ncbi:MAG: long-chain fatty acid--CoA ligase [Sandaracinus sp.]